MTLHFDSLKPDGIQSPGQQRVLSYIKWCRQRTDELCGF